MTYIAENKINSFIKNKKIRNILIITGKKSFNFSGFKKSKIYKNFRYITTIFFKKNKIPEINELNFLIKKVNLINPDLIIALGGGCALDYAKLANGLYNIKDLKKKIQSNLLKVNSKKTILIAIPTTAGSGAEVTKFSVIYIEKVKYSVEHVLLKPDFYTLVPKLVINSSRIVRASSGFDAISQAIESIFSKKANIHSLEYSSKSLGYSFKNFLGFVNKPNLVNTGKMLHAANLSGNAINIAKTNAPHALSYFFSTNFSLLHGLAVSIFFIEFINFFYFYSRRSNMKFNLKKRFKILFKSVNVNDISDFNRKFKNLLYGAGLFRRLKKYKKVSRDVKIINKILSSVNKERLYNSPIALSRKDIKKIISTKLDF